MKTSGINGLNIITNASPNGTGPGAQRSKRRWLATRVANGLLKPPELSNHVKNGSKVQFGNKITI